MDATTEKTSVTKRRGHRNVGIQIQEIQESNKGN